MPKWLKQRIFDLGSWLRDVSNNYGTYEPDGEEVRWWDVTISFRSTEKEVDALLERIDQVVCDNPNCGDFGEFCKRQWVGGRRLSPVPVDEHGTVSWSTTDTAGDYTFTMPLEGTG